MRRTECSNLAAREKEQAGPSCVNGFWQTRRAPPRILLRYIRGFVWIALWVQECESRTCLDGGGTSEVRPCLLNPEGDPNVAPDAA